MNQQTLYSKFSLLGIGDVLANKAAEVAKDHYATEIDNLLTINQKKTKTIQDLEEQVRQQKNYLREAGEELDKERSDKAPSRHQLQTLNSKVASLEADKLALTKEATEKHNAMSGAEARMGEAEERAQDLDNQLAIVNSRLVSAERDRDNHQIEERHLEGQLEREKIAFQELLETCHNQEKKIDNLENEHHERLLTISLLNSQLEDLQFKAKSWEKNCTDANTELNQLKAKNKDLADAARDYQFGQQQAEQARDQVIEENEKYRIAEAEAYQKREALKKDLLDARETIGKLENYCDQQSDVTINLRKELKDKEIKLQTLEELTQTQTKCIDELRAVATERKRQIDDHKCKPLVSFGVNPLELVEENLKLVCLVLSEQEKNKELLKTLERSANPQPFIINGPTKEANEQIAKFLKTMDTTPILPATAKRPSYEAAIQENFDLNFAVTNLKAKITELEEQLEAEINASGSLAEELGRVQHASGATEEELKAQKSELTRAIKKIEMLEKEAKELLDTIAEWEGVAERRLERAYEAEEALKVLARVFSHP